jgi:hypothetical protein
MSLGVDSGAGPVRSEGMQSARSHLNLELLDIGAWWVKLIGNSV